MATFIHKGRSIYFREYGRGEPLLLIHGLGSSGADWGLQLPVLEKRFHVIVPDLPGSGRSQPPREQYSIAGFASALWALLDQLKLDRVNIVGFSMGGAVGFEMSLQRPDGVHRLGLINSLATYRLDHWSKWLEARIPALLVPLIGMERMARLAAGRLFPRPWQRPLREAAAAVISAVPATSYLGMGLALQQWSAVDRLHRLKCKILLIAAEHDYTPLAEKRALAARLRAPIIVVRGSRHATPFDSVALTNASLLALLTDRPLPPDEEHICDTPAAVAALASPGVVYPYALADSPSRGSPLSCAPRESPAS